MKIYFAVTGQQEPIYLGLKKLNLLLSYHYYKDDMMLIKKLKNYGLDMFIDSGAFSAYNSKQTIDIDQYCKFIIESECQFYAGLDVLYNEKQTQANQEYMEKEYSLKPIPTFHKGESVEYLKDLVDNYPYIALGGLVFSGNLENYLDGVWKILLSKNPKIHVHGFGLTNQSHIQNYPWQSVDSSSFKGGKRFGRIALYNKSKKELFTKEYNQFLEDYYKLTFDERIKEDTSFMYEFTDTLSALSYARFVEDLSNKEERGKHLIQQQDLFDNN